MAKDEKVRLSLYIGVYIGCYPLEGKGGLQSSYNPNTNIRRLNLIYSKESKKGQREVR